MTLMVDRGGRRRARGVRTWVLVVGAVVLLAVGVGGGVLVGLASPAQGPAATAAGTPTPPVALSAPPPYSAASQSRRGRTGIGAALTTRLSSDGVVVLDVPAKLAVRGCGRCRPAKAVRATTRTRSRWVSRR